MSNAPISVPNSPTQDGNHDILDLESGLTSLNDTVIIQMNKEEPPPMKKSTKQPLLGATVKNQMEEEKQ